MIVIFFFVVGLLYIANGMVVKKDTSNKFTRFWKQIGPGLVTGASDDDPSGIATYSQAGAQYGLSTLWTALITFPLMAAIQEMCARIDGHTKNKLFKTRFIFNGAV